MKLDRAEEVLQMEVLDNEIQELHAQGNYKQTLDKLEEMHNLVKVNFGTQSR